MPKERELEVSDVKESEFSGCPTNSSMRYLTIIGGQVVCSECVRDLLVARYHAGLPVEADYAAISHLLHDGFVPQPLTVYRDVFSIGIGFHGKAGARRNYLSSTLPVSIEGFKG